eukprot:882681_1
MVYVRDYPFDPSSSAINPLVKWSLKYLPAPPFLTANKITLCGVFSMLFMAFIYVYVLNVDMFENIIHYPYLNIFYGVSVLWWTISDELDGVYARHYHQCSMAGDHLDHSADRILFAFVETIVFITTGIDTNIILPSLVGLFWLMNYIKYYRVFFFGSMDLDSSGTWFRVLAGVVPLLFGTLHPTHLLVSVISQYGWILFALINFRQMWFLFTHSSSGHKDKTDLFMNVSKMFAQKDVMYASIASMVYIILLIRYNWSASCNFNRIMMLLCESTVLSGVVTQYLYSKILICKNKPGIKHKQSLTSHMEGIGMAMVPFMCYVADNTIHLYYFWVILVCAWITQYIYIYFRFIAFHKRIVDSRQM